MGPHSIKPISEHKPLRHLPRDELQRSSKLQIPAQEPATVGALSEDRGDGALQDHGGESEQEDDEDDHDVETGLASEGKEPEEALAIEASSGEVRSGGSGQLAIGEDPLAVSIVRGIALEGEAIADRMEGSVIVVTVVVVDLGRRRRSFAGNTHE